MKPKQVGTGIPAGRRHRAERPMHGGIGNVVLKGPLFHGTSGAGFHSST